MRMVRIAGPIFSETEVFIGFRGFLRNSSGFCFLIQRFAVSEDQPGGNHDVSSPQLPAGHQLQTPGASPSLHDHTHLPHAPTLILITSSTSAHATPETARETITANYCGTTTNYGWIASDSWETYKTNPRPGSRRRRTCSFEGPRHRCSCCLLGGISTGQQVCCLPRYFRVCYDVLTLSSHSIQMVAYIQSSSLRIRHFPTMI